MEPWVKKMEERYEKERAAREAPKPGVNRWGHAVFPEGITEIRDNAFDGKKALRTAVLPDTVRRIGTRSFADCRNLRNLVLNEGLEEIDSNAFTGCDSLKRILFPDSIKKIEAYAFYRSAFQEPALNTSGDVLYRCPEISGRKKYTVPGQIRRIQSGAFLYLEELEEVILPEGLERIHTRSFLGTGVRKLILPASIQCVESRSFWGCKYLEEVVILCDRKALNTAAFIDCPNIKLVTPGQSLDFEEERRIRGLSIMTMNYKLEIPKRDFWEDPVFAALARRCAAGDTDAMMDFADYYETMGSGEFYTSAANFWRYRAYLYGNQKAIQWRTDWLRDKPGTLIPVALNPHLSGADGVKLRALGFEFFDPERAYSIGPKDKNGVVNVNSWCGTEGPDEDGFGMEELYDFWFMDEFLNPIPGSKVFSGWSSHSIRANPERYEYYREQAAEILREMRGREENHEKENPLF